MRRPLILVAGLCLAAVAGAQSKSTSSVLLAPSGGPAPSASGLVYKTPPIINQNLSPSGVEMVIDITGEQSWDLLNDASNTVLTIPLGNGALMNGIGWDVHLVTVGGSWLSEARFYFDGSDQDLSGLFLTPGAGNSFSGDMVFSSGGVLDLTDNGIPDIPILADGNLYIQLHETFDDVPDAVDANWVASSELTISFTPGSGVPATNRWGMIALGSALLGGVGLVAVRMQRQRVPATS